MTQVNITLSHEEVLQVLSGDRDDAFKMLVERILNAVMLAESEEQLGASMHERTDDRLDYRNGVRERTLHTRIGTLTLAVPRHRSQPFHIAKTTTSKSVSLALSNYYPYSGKPKISQFKFRVRGISKNEKWSDWVAQAFSVDLPAKPSVSVSPNENNYNQCTFSWSVNTSNTHKIFTDVEIQTKLVTNYDYGGEKGWTAATGGVSGSKTYTETASTVASGSHTRWFRVRARGPRGVSDWAYGCRVYSAPYAASNVKAEVSKQSGGMQTKVTWTQTRNNAYPVDSQTAEYAIQVPGPGLTYNGNPDGTIGTVAGAGGAASAFISQNPAKDECLFVRVSGTHLYKTTYSGWVLASPGFLKDPEITDIQADDRTFRATITANNTSDVTDSFLVVLYRTGSEPDNYKKYCICWSSYSHSQRNGSIEWGSYSHGVRYRSEPRCGCYRKEYAAISGGIYVEEK